MTSHDNVTDIVERLSYLHVWPQSIGSTYADTLTPRQIERLYDVGNVATEAAEEIISLRKQLENAREALREYLEAEEIDDPAIRMQELSVCREQARKALSAIKGDKS